MTYILFATALALSTMAAFYSIMGLTAIFAAAVVPILIMGSLLELSKLVVASWLYRSWKQIPFLMKSYFLTALLVLMFLTSMGIFGYLSKAHLDQAVPAGDIIAKIELVDSKIKSEKDIIDESRKSLTQLDAAVDQTLARSTDTIGASKSANLRRSQTAERKALNDQIQASTLKIQQLNQERAPLAAENRKIEAEVGPIKYIAALIYGDSPDTNLLEKAVRVVILLIVVVFDPLAVLMLVAANWQLLRDKEQKAIIPVKEEVVEQPVVQPTEIEVEVEKPVEVEPKVAKPSLPKTESKTSKSVETIPEETQDIIDSFFNKPPRKPRHHKIEFVDDLSLSDDMAVETLSPPEKSKTKRVLM